MSTQNPAASTQKQPVSPVITLLEVRLHNISLSYRYGGMNMCDMDVAKATVQTICTFKEIKLFIYFGLKQNQ